MKARLQPIMLLRNNQQKIVTDGYPYLREDGVHGCTVESLDMQVLLDPFEEDLHLPSFSVKFGNSDGLKVEVVCKETIEGAVSKVFIRNKPHCVRELLGGDVSREFDGLVGYKTCLRINLAALKDLIPHVIFRSGHEPCMFEMKVLEKGIKAYISFIHKIVCICLYRYLTHYFRVMNFAGSKKDECGDRASKVKKCMHFEGTTTMMELSPWTQLKTKFNCAAVKGVDHLIKIYSELVSIIKSSRFLCQRHRKILIDTPVLLLVHLGKSRLGHNLKSRPVQVLRTKIKSSFNVSQTTPVCVLSKAHNQELVTTVEFDGMPVALVAIDTLAELIFGEKGHKLRENCSSFVHGLRESDSLPVCKLTTSSNQKIISAL